MISDDCQAANFSSIFIETLNKSMMTSKKTASAYLIALLIYLVAPPLSTLFSSGISSLDEAGVSRAVALHSVLGILMIMGYFFSNRPLRKKPSPNLRAYKIYQKRYYFAFCYLLTVIGLVSAIYSATYDMGLSKFIYSLIAGDANLRESFMESSRAGGVSGLIKVQAYLPLAVLITVIVQRLFFDGEVAQVEKLNRLMIFSTVVVFIKTLFTQDRMTLVALGVIFGTYFLRKMTISKFLWIALSLVMASYVSSLRLKGYGIGRFLVLYGKLGLVNLQQDISHTSTFGFGIQTVFHPLIFVWHIFGSFIDTDNSISRWVWNPAQNLDGYLYIDFGAFCVLFGFLIGILLGRIDFMSRSGSFRWRAIYFNFLYCIISFIGVPAFRGPEFWYAIIVEIFLLKMIGVGGVRFAENLST